MEPLIGGKEFVKEYLGVIHIAVNNADRIRESCMLTILCLEDWVELIMTRIYKYYVKSVI
jgi:hypothetical protein